METISKWKMLDVLYTERAMLQDERERTTDKEKANEMTVRISELHMVAGAMLRNRLISQEEYTDFLGFDLKYI